MDNTPTFKNRDIADDEIDLLELWNVLWKGKWIIIAITFTFAVVSVFYALSLTDIYRTEVLLAPADEEGSSGGLAELGQLGGLASLVGVNLGGSSSVTQKDRALAILRSRVFIKDFVNKYELVVPLMGTKPGEIAGTVEIDPNLYDEANQQWVRLPSPAGNVIPSDEEVYEAFSQLLDVESNESGLITVGLEWYDPSQIKTWMDWLVDDVNSYMREDDLLESQLAIDYLTEQLQKTSLVEMRNVFFNLIEQQTQKVMLADVRKEYAFEILDPAVIPEVKSGPFRSLICIFVTLLGGIIAVPFVFLRHYASKGKEDLA